MTFKKWKDFHQKKNGQNGYDSHCKKCRKIERARRNKELRAKNEKFFIDEDNLTFDCEVIGEISQEQIASASMIIVQAYKNRGTNNG